MTDRLKIGTVGVTVEIGGSVPQPNWFLGDAAVVAGNGTAFDAYKWRNLRTGEVREWYAYRFRLLEDMADD